MANKFVFKDNGTELDIAGNKFFVDVTDPELIESVLEFARGAEKRAEELKKSDNYVEELRNIIAYCLGVIDNILGGGASDKIFKGQKVSLAKALSVLSYMVDVINSDKVDYFSEYSPNRAERRKK